MTTEPTESGESKDEVEGRINRRSVLKAAGVATVGLGALAGNASATIEACFYGCSQVCVDKAGSKAVVVKNGDLKCVEITEQHQSNRNDPCARGLRSGAVGGTKVYCLSIDDVDATAIVGACGDGTFVPNNTHTNVRSKTDVCAKNYAEYLPDRLVNEDGSLKTGQDCPC